MPAPVAAHLAGLQTAVETVLADLRSQPGADPKAALMSALGVDALDGASLLRRLIGPARGVDGEGTDVSDVLGGLMAGALGEDWTLTLPGVGQLDDTGGPGALNAAKTLDPAGVLSMRAAGGAEVTGPLGVKVGAIELDLDLGKTRIELRAAGLELRLKDPTGLLAVLGVGDIAVGGDVGAVVDTDGFRFTGGSRSQVELAASSASGLRDPRFGIEQTGPSALALTASFRGELAGMTAVIERIGLDFELGADGPRLSYRPPSGVGLSLAGASGMSGGGFLSERDGAYRGMLDLDVGPVEVTAFGLLHPEPFSLIIVLSAQFTPGIQLSFGFMLGGVGGILGIGHRVDVAALNEAVQAGTVDHLLFPSDPVASAPAILESLARIFPTQSDSAVFGPLFRLTWGPVIPLITADLGVVLELPEFRFVLLGHLRVALPHPDVAIIDLRASLSGVIDPGQGLLEINVALTGSRVSGFAVSGGLVLRVETGGSGEFILSAGGFHPRYVPPQGMAVPQRLEIKLADTAVLQIGFRGYFALTSGSVQAGARLDLVAGDEDTGISGTVGFDVLLRWSPSFAFSASLYGSFALRAGGATICSVSIDVMLEGPSPCWHVAGTASVRLLFIEVSFHVDESWGRQSEPELPPPDVVGAVLAALSRPEAWSSLMPAGTTGILRLRNAEPGDQLPGLLVHPLGKLVVRQEVAPLNTVITRFGAAPLKPTTLALTAQPGDSLGSGAERSRFATGQFITLSEDQQLTQPAFDEYDAGVTVEGGAATTSTTVRAVAIAYEDKTIRGDDTDVVPMIGLLDATMLTTAVAMGAVGRSDIHAARSRYRSDTTPQVAVRPEAERLVAVDILTRAPFAIAEVDTARTHAEAKLALDASPERRGLTLVSAWEIEG